MNCFNHRNIPAIGLCKSCGKGLCEDCAAELATGIACKAACENAVDLHSSEVQNILSTMLELDKRISRTSRNQIRSSGVIALLLGIGLLIFAVWAYREIGSLIPYFLGMYGILSLAMGILRLNWQKEYSLTEMNRD